MNYFNRSKWWAIAFILLLVMNIATLATIWLVREKRPAADRIGGREVASFLVKELGLDSVQEQKLMELRTVHQAATMRLRGRTRQAKDSFFALLKEPSLPDSVLEKAAHASSANDQQLDILTFRHLQKIREMCTPQQKEKFDAVIHEVLRSMGGAGPAPPPPGGRPGGPPPPGNGQGELPPPPPGADRPPPQQ